MTREQVLKQIRGQQNKSASKPNNHQIDDSTKYSRAKSLEKAREAAAKARKSKKDKK